MFGFSMGEILFIGLIAIVLFGNENLPQNIRKFMKGWGEIKSTIFGLQRSWTDIKDNLKYDLEYLETQVPEKNKEENNFVQRSANLEEALVEGSASQVKAAVTTPVYEPVSQEEIDSHQLKIGEAVVSESSSSMLN
jgi:Sec-independent protein translocase protein TatA